MRLGLVEQGTPRTPMRCDRRCQQVFCSMTSYSPCAGLDIAVSRHYWQWPWSVFAAMWGGAMWVS